MDKNVCEAIGRYGSIMSFIGTEGRTLEEVRAFIKSKLKKDDQNTRNYIAKLENLDYPFIVARDGKYVIDEMAMRSFTEQLYKEMGSDAYKVFSMPYVKKDGQQPSVEESKNYKNIKSENSILKKEKSELQAQVEQLEKSIIENAAQKILFQLDKSVIDISGMHSIPKDKFYQDIFDGKKEELLDVDSIALKKYPEYGSLYQENKDASKELNAKTYSRKVSKAIDIMKQLFVHSENKEEQQVQEKKNKSESEVERLLAVNELLGNHSITNQEKLARYSLLYDAPNYDMEELLSYAGDCCVDADTVIRLLENADDNATYRKLRAYLRQIAKYSEAHIKKDAARELISGDWYVVAEYNGKPCQFRMMPVDEIKAMQQLLKESMYPEAVAKMEELLLEVRKANFVGNEPNQSMKIDWEAMRSLDPEAVKNACRMIHSHDGDVDIHAKINEDEAYEGFSEEE